MPECTCEYFLLVRLCLCITIEFQACERHERL